MQLFHSPPGGCGAGLRARPCRGSRAWQAGKRQGQRQPHLGPIPRREEGSGPGWPPALRDRLSLAATTPPNSLLAPFSTAEAGGRTEKHGSSPFERRSKTPGSEPFPTLLAAERLITPPHRAQQRRARRPPALRGGLPGKRRHRGRPGALRPTESPRAAASPGPGDPGCPPVPRGWAPPPPRWRRAVRAAPPPLPARHRPGRRAAAAGEGCPAAGAGARGGAVPRAEPAALPATLGCGGGGGAGSDSGA